MRLIHWTDTHLGAEGADNAAVLSRCALDVQARALGGEALAVVLTGDITDDGQAWQWRQVHTALAPLVGLVPVYAVVGNHDTGMRGVTYDEARAERSADALTLLCPTPLRRADGLKVWRVGGYKLIGLDSCTGNADDLLPPLARGEIGREQLLALEVELADVVPTIIVLHHHPLWSDWAHALEDSVALLHLLDRRDHVEFVLYGHRHLEGHRLRAGTDYLAGGKTTDAVKGKIHWREIDLETGQISRREIDV